MPPNKQIALEPALEHGARRQPAGGHGRTARLAMRHAAGEIRARRIRALGEDPDARAAKLRRAYAASALISA